jgi:membrane protease YdiL (CAAX protease family)
MDDHSSEPVSLQGNVEKDLAVVSWSGVDTWLGFGIYVILVSLSLFAAAFNPSTATGVLFMVGFEFLLLVPITVIFLWRKISWKELGFRAFEWSSIGLGCGLLVMVYVVIIIHNLILSALGVAMQGDVVFGLFSKLESPALLFFVGIVLAPIMEEIFFRGFLFRGFRQRYGLNTALILSSFIFALSHMQLAALLPTFLLGGVLAYMAHRSNSVFPGMILHFMINAWGFCALFAAYKLNGI